MIGMKRLKVYFAGLLCIAHFALSYAADLTDYADPSKVVKAFCQSEFEGVPDQEQRDQLVKFSKELNDLHWKEFGRDASWVDTTVDQLILVSRYEIEKVSIHGRNGLASVLYQQVARTKGVGAYDRTFVKDVRPNQLVQLTLFNDGKRWWVNNPGTPRVSGEFVKNEEKQIFQRYMERKKKSGLSPLELRSFNKLKENIAVLENLGK